MKKILSLILSFAMVLSMTGCMITIDGEENLSQTNAAASGTIGLSVSTQNNPFFVTLVEGAQAQADKLGVELSVADAGDDVTKQTSDIEDLVAKGISVLIVNPVDSDAVTGAVEAAMAKGVKVISVDRAVNGVEIACQIASDNVLGAELATQYIVDTLGEGVKVAELEGIPGASAAIDRSQGFHNVADAKLDVVAKQTANFDRTEGMSVMENILQANGDVQAVFAANDEMALGAVEAITGAGKQVMVVGFDATDDAIEAIKAGKMAGTIAQQPALIGSTAVDNAVKLMAGETIPTEIPVEVTLVNKDNADSFGAPAKVEVVGNGSIGLAVSTQNNPFFVTLVEGAQAAADKLGVTLTVADAGDDVTKQVSNVEDLVATGISVLIINPVDSDAVTGVVEAAMAKGVHVISVDRAVNGVEIACQIASDNVLGAELATQYIVDTLGEGVKVAELEGIPGASAAIDRSAGFHNVADAKLNVAAKQTANFDRTQGMSVMENILQADGDIKAVFAANDEMALGAVEAISGAGKQIMVMGFDATDDAIEAIKAGKMAGTIAQQPALIGSTAVENAVTLIGGTAIAKSIPVEVTLVTKDNVDTFNAPKAEAVEIVGNGSIGLAVSTQNNPFFVTLVEGAQAAADKLGVTLTVADAGDDVTKQVSNVEDLVATGISVLIINPVDSDAVTGVVEAAMAKGVHVISVDRAVNGVDIACQIASDNVLGAELATQYIVDTLGEGVKVAELEGIPGASAAIDRSAGFHNIADTKLDVVAKQTANFDRTQGMSVMENILQANGDIQAVFAANDEMALGAVEAISGAGKKVMVMGFDATDDAIEAIKAGRMAGTIAQQPALIGSTAVENAVKLIGGESIAKTIPVEVTLITAENAK